MIIALRSLLCTYCSFKLYIVVFNPIYLVLVFWTLQQCDHIISNKSSSVVKSNVHWQKQQALWKNYEYTTSIYLIRWWWQYITQIYLTALLRPRYIRLSARRDGNFETVLPSQPMPLRVVVL